MGRHRVSALHRFVESYREADAYWTELDRPIIQYCHDNPDHAEKEKVYAKVALVNRVYRANIQMSLPGTEMLLAKELVAKEADSHLRPAKDVTTFNRETFPSILEAHGWLVWFTQQVTNKAHLSFAAKYLSFHNPAAVPILDRKAEAVAKSLVGHLVPRGLHPGFPNTRYAVFCEHVLALVDELRRAGEEVHMKRLDAVLYGDT